ncbi:MAG: hypothetical protein ISR82_03800 [Candidatus Marinimicrobia bacterium]|nr:hypothetical protein [Candidatus Neomarinimicrobiota bacterium]MBL7010328.1 hypothetical protein [Candidatus Neomarinimicrobiota bacterium]MBL7030044.1 hypothetical protein [Candidatus Neomarinimicrobiota bacterium]
MTSHKAVYWGLLTGFLISQDSTQLGLPSQIGPIIDSLPILDSLWVDTLQTKNESPNHSAVQPLNQPNLFPINASGTFFRGIEMSSQGMGGLNGGLRFQLAGKLSENIRVSGTVTDESFPIQPEGNTAALDELDKVYLNVSYPAGDLTAGDLTVTNKSGKFNNNKRNIVGIKNSIKQNNMKIRTIIGQSKGKYNRVELKGSDGRQGPYFLTSKDGQRNVIISAGSETVWLNGQKLGRGEDRDYTIDYASAELTFTPKHLIYFDSDIDIEYQYSESTYTSNYMGAGLDGTIGEKGQYSISYIDERDNTSVSFLTSEQKTAFKENDIVYQSGVVQDSLGDYALINGTYLFMHAAYYVLPEDRYTVTFSPDPAGEYVRKISEQNRIYYAFVFTDEIDNRQRYSPGRSLRAPVSHQLLQFDSNISLRQGMSLSTEGAFSVQENNVYSNRSASQNNGNAFRMALDQKEISLGKIQLGFGLEYWQNSSDFQSLSRDRSVNFNESWDVTNLEEKSGESMSSLKTEIEIGNRLKSEIDLSRLARGDTKRDRTEINLNYNGKLINNARVRWNKVQSEIGFQELDGHIRLFNGPLKPFVTLVHEMREKSYRFDDMLVGLDFAGINRSFSLGVGQREDQLASFNDPTKMETTQTGKILQADYKSRQKSGWRQEWMYRQRIQENDEGEKQNDFNSMRAAVNFRDRKSPFQLDLVLNSQISMRETRAVVYDSIGVGLGYYRYDSKLNEYISDANGAYVAHTVFTGDRKHGSQLDGLTRFSIDFSKWKFDRLKNWKYRYLYRLNFHGSKFSILKAQMDVGEVYRNNFRHELIHKKRKGKNRHRIWNQNTFNYNGLDPRGWELRDRMEYGLESQISLSHNNHLIFDGDYHKATVWSENDRITPRDLIGFNSELGIKGQSEGNFQWDSRVVYYQDHIEFKPFKPQIVDAIGMKMNWTQFIGNDGRIEGNVEYYQANGFESMPPEALKGIANNQTIRANIMASMFLGKSLSVNATMFYIDDDRYNGFIKLRGEVRAHF